MNVSKGKNLGQEKEIILIYLMTRERYQRFQTRLYYSEKDIIDSKPDIITQRRSSIADDGIFSY